MEILQLRYFMESARSQSFAKTAEKYHVPATSVSASVKRLEKELGCELFHRTCNRIILNDKGSRFLQSVEAMFGELETAVTSLSPANIDTRAIRMLVRTTRSEITQIIIAYKKKHPHSTFKTVFDFRETNFEDYDIIIDEKKNDYPKHASFDLLQTQIRFRVAKSHPLRGKKLTMGQLKGQAFVSIGENSSLNQILMDTCRKAGFIPNIAIQSNDIKCCENCVAAGVGIGLARQYPGSNLASDIEYLDVTDFNHTQTICCYYKEASAYGNVREFLVFLKSRMKP